ncbi:MAG TPA: phosphoglucosamine mutase [Terriglobia bacterium]
MESGPQLFGTDGVRGVAGEYPLDRATVWKLGCALGKVLQRSADGRPIRVVLGRDTRESGPWIADLFATGLASAGVGVGDAGVVTTPGVAYLTRSHGFAAGVVISASHNPFRDNGIKVFSTAGTKLPESVEVEIERAMEEVTAEASASNGFVEPVADLERDYVTFLANLASGLEGLPSLRLVADCAYGAAARVAPDLLQELGIPVQVLNASPDGRNINLNCGSLHPEGLADATRAAGADLGVAFDGDADRAKFATRSGRVLDGDYVLYAAAQLLQDRRELRGGAVVGTLMSNFALERELALRGLGLKRAAVGDRYVLEEMLRSGINLGGEPSGHIIFADQSLAGDGLITLLQVLRIVSETGKSLEELVSGYAPLPQLILNVRVRTKPPLESIPEIRDAIEACRRNIDGNGRVVVRYSGTEPLARVMVEAEDGVVVERHAEAIAGAIESAIGEGAAHSGS